MNEKNEKIDAVEQAVRSLGQVLQADVRYQKYITAKQESDNDVVLQELLQTFQYVQMQYQQEKSRLSEIQNAEKIAESESKASILYSEIRENPHMMTLEAAQLAWDEMVQMVYGILSRCISGEVPETCSKAAKSGCSGCHGCA